MVESLESRTKKLEKQSAKSTEEVTFTVYSVRVHDSGHVTRRNLESGKVSRVSAAKLGIEAFTEQLEIPKPKAKETPVQVAVAPAPTVTEPEPGATIDIDDFWRWWDTLK